MRRFFTALLSTAVLWSAPLAAQEPDSIFDSYDDMRAQMDALVMERDIQGLMLRFGAADEMTPQQLDSLDAQVEQIYPRNFDTVAVMRSVSHRNGFNQELIAYWTGTNYLYTYVFYHDRDGRTVSINFRFNSEFHTLNDLF